MTSMINSIAFQANNLALIAAMEGERAGDMGLKFADVAGEVKNLARRGGQAAQEITTLVNESVELVGYGSLLVDRAGQIMKEIAASVINAAAIMGEIAAASDERGHGASHARRPIYNMAIQTRLDVALVRKAGDTAASLEEQASLLVDVASIFRLSQALAVGGAQSVLAPVASEDRAPDAKGQF